MLYALHNNDYALARPGLNAQCPYCLSDVISKCGNIKIWHWAHAVKTDACAYKEMSEWHIKHQLAAEINGWKLEQKIGNDAIGYRIADCMYKNNIIELQKSSISDNEIVMRNAHYNVFGKNIHWLFDFRDKADNLRFTAENGIVKFKQSWARKTIIVLFDYIDNNNKPIWGNVFLNVSDTEYIKVEKMYDSGNGYGRVTDFNGILKACSDYRKPRF